MVLIQILILHKKGDKQIVIVILEKIIFDLIMRFLKEHKLQSDAQSGFRPSESCDCQLLSVVHDIYKSFDCNRTLESLA